jgi:hypothetical protein
MVNKSFPKFININLDKKEEKIFKKYPEIKNLLNLSNINNINIFKLNRKKWVIKDRRQLIRECNKEKKKALKNLSKNITKLAKNIGKDDISNLNIETTNDQYYKRVNNIDSMINELISERTEKLKNLKFPITELINKSSYIDVYEN